MDARETLTGGLAAIVVAAVSAFGGWVASRRMAGAAEITAEAAEVTADAAWQSTMNDGFAKLTQQYDAANEKLLSRVAQMEGTIRDLVQHIEGLEKILRDEGLPIPVRRHPLIGSNGLIIMDGGKS